MKAWGCITANGNILPRTIRASEGEAYQVAQAEPLAAWVVKLHVAIDQRWLAQKRREMLNAQARSIGAAE